MALTPEQIAKIAKEESDKILKEMTKKDSPNAGSPYNIKIGNDFEAKAQLNQQFKEFLSLVKKNGVVAPVPVQFGLEIGVTPGNWGQIQNAHYEGRMESNLLKISRTNTAPTLYWTTTNPAATNSTSSAASAYDYNVTMARGTIKLPIDDWRLDSMGYDVLNYAKTEATKQYWKGLDYQMFVGTGTSTDPFIGLINDPSVQKVNSTTAALNSSTGVGITVLRSMLSKIDPQYRDENLCWYVSKGLEGNLLGVQDANNRIVDVANNTTKLLGFEIKSMSSGILADDMTGSSTGKQNFIVLANLKQAYTYANKGLVVEPIRTVVGVTDYYFYDYVAMGNWQYNAASVIYTTA